MPPDRFSHSSLASWRRCRYRYYLSYIANYMPKSGIGQYRGTIGHACLGEWYLNGGDDEKALKKAAEIANNIEIETGTDLSGEWDVLLVVFNRYFNWARQNDSFKTIAIEQEYEIEIDGVKLMGYIDGIVQMRGENWLLEHKFLKNASIEHIGLDMQVSIYMLAAHKLGYNPYGCFYNVIRMAKTGIAAEEPVIRRPVYRNPEGLAVVERELSNQLRELRRFNEEGANFLNIYRNPTKDCHWDCGFYRVCLSLNDSGEAESVLRTIPINEKYKTKEGDENGE